MFSILLTSRRVAHLRATALSVFGLILVSVVSPDSAGATSPRIAGADSYTVDRPSGLPVWFEPNLGQSDEHVLFSGRFAGYRADFASDAVTLGVGPTASASDALDGVVESVRMTFVGGRAAARPSAEQSLPGRVNYLLGSDPEGWIAGVPTYGAVRYSDVYRGIDALFYGNERSLEYDFEVAPGADPSDVRLQFEGCVAPEVDDNGDLVLRLKDGSLLHRARVYQRIGTERRTVAARFLVRADGVTSFIVGEYDRAHPLVIDPVVVYTRFVAGSDVDRPSVLKITESGDLLIFGSTESLDFPTTPGGMDALFNGGSDGFVAKMTADGSSLVFSTFFGGSGGDQAEGADVDASGALYVTGITDSADFPTTVGSFDPTYSASSGAETFVLKLAEDGASLLYSTYLGGSNHETATDLAVSATGEACVIGLTFSGDFPTVAGSYDTAYSAVYDSYVTKMTADGSALVFSTYLGGTRDDFADEVAVDDSGAVLICGSTSSTEFPVTAGAFSVVLSGGTDLFVTKLAPNGASVLYSTFVGGTHGENATGLAVGETGTVYVAGTTTSANYPVTAGAFDESFNGGMDAFITKLDTNGQQLGYSTYLGGAGYDVAHDIAIDAFGAAYVTGSSPEGFPTTPGAYDDSHNGNSDIFLTKVDSNGAIRYSTLLGGSYIDSGSLVAVGPDRSVYIVGETQSTDFATEGFGTRGQLEDVFLTKLRIPSGDTAGVYLPGTGTWFLRDSNSPGAADRAFSYGPNGLAWTPLAGDWDGDGDDTPGLYDAASGFFFLSNESAPGPADLVFGFGPGSLGWRPIVGDWDGDGDDTVGLYDPEGSTFFLRDENAPGGADMVFGFGPGGLGWLPVVGDWDGDGNDTVGLYDAASGYFYLRQEHAPGSADLVYGFGPSGLGWTPLAGDWDGDGRDSVGLYDPATGYFFLRIAHEGGPADAVFGYGAPGADPIVGDWDGQ
jgi:hypothetical protein